MCRILSIIIIFLLIPHNTYAKFVANGFFIEKKQYKFRHHLFYRGLCEGTVPYPIVSNSDESLIITINNKISKFIKRYSICNSGKKNPFSVDFDIPSSGNMDYFSIRWITKKNNKNWRIDSLNFNRDTGKIIKIGSIFNQFSEHFIDKMIELSQGGLKHDSTWDDFLKMVKKRKIQFYIKDKKWHIIFNPYSDKKHWKTKHKKANKNQNNIIDVVIPEYFLKRQYDR